MKLSYKIGFIWNVPYLHGKLKHFIIIYDKINFLTEKLFFGIS